MYRLQSTNDDRARSVCAHPTNSDAFWVGADRTIRYCDGQSLRLIAGSGVLGRVDGLGETAQFNGVFGLVYVQSTKRLIASDVWNNCIRSVNVHSVVSTICGDRSTIPKDGRGVKCSIQYPRNLVFDRASNVEPESAVYITSGSGIRRLDLVTTRMTSISLGPTPTVSDLDLHGIDCIAGTGNLIVSCVRTNSVYFVEPKTGAIEFLSGARPPPPLKPLTETESGGTGTGSGHQHHMQWINDSSRNWQWINQLAVEASHFRGPSAVLIALPTDDSGSHSVLVCDRGNSQIKQIALPAKYFIRY